MPERFFISRLVESQPGCPSCSHAISGLAGLLHAPRPWSCLPTSTAGSWQHPNLQGAWHQASAAGCQRQRPSKGGDKTQGLGTCSVFKLAGKTGEDHRAPRRKARQEPTVISQAGFGGESGSAGCFHKSCQWQSS